MKMLYSEILFHIPIALVYLFMLVSEYIFGRILNKFSKSFSVTPSSRCRISAKLTYLLINMKSLYEHIMKVGEMR